MAISDILNLKKENRETKTQIFKRHLVVGDDLFAVMAYEKLKQKFGEDNVFILSLDPILRDSVVPIGPSEVRGENNIEAFKSLYPEVQTYLDENPSIFLKEQEFRDFGGRAKSEKLLFSEEFYKEKKINFDYVSIFPFLNDEKFWDNLNTKRISTEVKSVTPAIATDLVDPANFLVECFNNEVIGCEHLYWAKNPSNFLAKYANKNELSKELFEICESTKGPCKLSLRFDLSLSKEEIELEKRTMFFPLSYTHEWGHFIGEFSKNRAEFIHFLEKESTSEDEIAKRIRILKRYLDKIFPNLTKNLGSEFIRVEETSGCLNFDGFVDLQNDPFAKNITFLSVNGPMVKPRGSFEDSFLGLSHMSKALVLNKTL